LRVSDNTSKGVVQESIRRSRSRLEDLQIKNSTQKKLTSIADDPAAHTKIMDIRTQSTVNNQFESNAVLAKNRLQMTDLALSEIYDIFVRAKEIAINQSSEASANADSRIGVAQEVSSLYNQLVSIANRRIGQQYLFGGFKTLTSPYTQDGTYKGDSGEIKSEIQKDVFISVNLPGNKVFEFEKYRPEDRFKDPSLGFNRQPSSDSQNELATAQPAEKINLFKELDSLRVGLMTNDTITIRDSLDKLDDIINHIIMLRTNVSSRVSGIDTALSQTEKIDLANVELSSKLEDADYAELWSDLAREETVFRSSLQAAQKLMQPTLLDFIK
jgi:flagellar hook-associated protein 3 FlgL